MNRPVTPDILKDGAAPRNSAATGVSDTPIAAQFAEFADNFALSDVPDNIINRSKLHILDCIGIALASTTFDFAHKAATAIAGLGGEGAIPVIGMPLSLPPRDAAHLNGTLIHGLDFDDTHSGAVTHISASAVATLISAGLHNRSSGPDAIAAYLLATETAARIGKAANGGFHEVGYHPTGLVGAFSSALAAGYLGHLSSGQLAHAQGITLSMAAGSLEFLTDGAWTKRMHPGWAAFCGITAAAMAKAGFIGPSAPYEGRYGLFSSHTAPDKDVDLSNIAEGLGQEWELLNVAFKPYPACHFNHAFADAALALRDNPALKSAGLGAIDKITAYIGEGQVPVVCEPEVNKKHPQNAYDAQFSVHYTIAASLTRGRFTLGELDPEVISDPDILSLADKVGYEVDPDSAYPRYYSGEVAVTLKDGTELRHREAVNRGSDAKPLSESDIFSKFKSNAERAVSSRRVSRIADAVDALPKSDDLSALAAAIAG